MPTSFGIKMNIKLEGIPRVINNLKRIQKQIPIRSSVTIKESVIAGKKFAKAIAPKQTGALIRAIHFRTEGKTRRRIGWVESLQPDHPKSGKEVPYHLWMHGIGRRNTSKLIRTGEPFYMFKTFDFLKTLFPKKMNNTIKAIIK